MIEAILTLCLMSDPTMCRDVLLPARACDAAVEAPAGLVAKGPLRCEPAHPGAAVVEIAPGVFVHQGQVADAGPKVGGDLSNSGFVIGSKAVAVIDAGGSRATGEALYRAVRARTDLPIRHVILTHMHPDHIFGATVFAEAGAEVIGHANLARALADRADSYLNNYGNRLGADFVGSTLPEITAPPRDLDLGGRVLRLHSWPLAHTTTDVTVLDQTSGTVFAGDLIFHRHIPALDGSLRGWQRVLAELTTLGARQVVPGHGAPVLSLDEALTPMNRYLSRLAADTRAAIDEGQSMGRAIETIAQDERPNWQLFDLYNPRNATVAFSELEWE